MKKQSGKKLVEILAVELKEWPEGRLAFSQDSDGFLNKLDFGVEITDVEPIQSFENGIRIWSGRQWAAHSAVRLSGIAEDCETAIVTREMWEAERARLEGEKVMRACVDKCEQASKPKANGQGWVRNRGRKNPFDVCTLVDARLRSGDVVTGKFSENLHWVHTGGLLYVMAYRVNESVEAAEREVTATIDPVVVQNVNAFNARAEMPAAKYFDGPLQWRDRISEIDVEMRDMGRERKSLVDKLAAEGFAMIGHKAQ